MFDDGKIPGDVKVSIFRQLDPIVRADRYALHNCLLVSRPYFELAAERLWSSQRLPNAFFRNRFDALLNHALTTDPPSTTDGERSLPSSGAGWRIGIYLQSIRALLCCPRSVNKSSALVPPSVLLPWLRKLDSVDVSRADETWFKALTERLALPGQTPRHLVLSPSTAMYGASTLASHIGRRVHSLEICLLGHKGEDGDCAKILDHFASAAKAGWVRKMVIVGVVRGKDADVIEKVAIAHGSTLRNLSSHRITVTKSLLTSVSQLTSLKIGIDVENVDAVSKLVSASQSTLIEIEVGGPVTAEVLNLVPLEMLEKLKYLDVGIDVLDASVKDLPFGSMNTVTQLTFSASNFERLDPIMDLLASINKMTALQELDITITQFLGYNREVDEDEEGEHVDVPLRLTNLRKLNLDWKVTAPSSFGFRILDWETVESRGLPLLEELEVKVHNFYRIDDENVRSLPELIYGILLDDVRTPALVYSRVELIKNNADDMERDDHDQDMLYIFEWRGVGEILGLPRAGAAEIEWEGQGGDWDWGDGVGEEKARFEDDDVGSEDQR
ncbi:hypothetical protein HK101_001809 [Irineochytrium annulatum]|nr:hypothetical protein HK101_001809 [Irineochytrium annulatum]